ncbi:MAG TPA: HNH endonuclease signature motif containing protein [Bdellovibrionales bacterium]|nr:HNH endonuclease signature motif containing protein [Bdellovibrionales bacterium]
MHEIVSFKKRSALKIHKDAMATAKNIKTEYIRMFDILLEVESHQIYFDFEIPSLHDYCVELLELSNQVAKDFGVVVRKALEVPELAAAIRSGKLTISKARKICPVLDQKNHREWIDLSIHCSCRDIERTVAMANPKAAIYESMKYVSGDALEFRMGVSENWTEELQRTKDLLSQKLKRAVSSEEALFILMREYNQKNDPVEKAKRAQTKKSKKLSLVNTEAKKETSSRTRYRSAEIEHRVDLRDLNQCVYVDKNGKRCGSKRWLEKHHILEFANGGDHSPDNLETLCWAHHTIKHRKSVNSSVT